MKFNPGNGLDSSPPVTASGLASRATSCPETLSRYFYTVAAIVVTLVAFAGFSRTYFMRGAFGTPGKLATLLHLHGLVMTAWVGLFAVQSWLIPSRRVAIHRRLGIFGVMLAVVVLVVGAATVMSAAARTGASGRIGPGELFLFAVFATLGIAWRKRGDFHKRLMLLSNVTMMPAAIARIPFAFIKSGGPPAVFGVVDLFILGCAVYDYRKSRRLHPVFLWGGLLIVSSQVFRPQLIKVVMGFLQLFRG